MAEICVIDDDTEFAQNVAAILAEEGHSVRSLHAIDGAVEDLVRRPPDVLVLDVMFPENPVAGFEIARRIRTTVSRLMKSSRSAVKNRNGSLFDTWHESCCKSISTDSPRLFFYPVMLLRKPYARSRNWYTRRRWSRWCRGEWLHRHTRSRILGWLV